MSVNWKDVSPDDFERIIRDLFSIHFQQRVESFTPGRDDGIDLRMEDNTIIQCKRYTRNFQQLISSLKKESNKKGVKEAGKYVLVTTLGLTPQNKQKLVETFPIIKDTKNIFASDDLEWLLSQYHKVRELYPCLWAGDSTIIKSLISDVLTRAIDERSKVEFEKINERMCFLVQHPEFESRLRQIEQNKVLIITGEPGVGKTSFAQYLTWKIMHNTDCEFVYIASNISEAEQKFKSSQAQLFLYDDFLGSNFLEDRLQKNEDRSIYNFINRVQKSENKYAIFTTREYILQQAYTKYERLKDSEQWFSKFILNIRDNKLEYKARILYNHIWYNKLPNSAVKSLLSCDGKNIFSSMPLIKILNHKSYVPRIIEWMVRSEKSEGKDIEHDNFAQRILGMLDHPHDLYKRVFLQQVSEDQRSILLIVAMNPSALKLKELKERFYERRAFVGNRDTIDFNDCLRELDGSLTTSEKNQGTDEIMVDFINPGIRDYLHQYLIDNPSLLDFFINTASLSQEKYLYSFFRKKSFPDREKYVNKLITKYINQVDKACAEYKCSSELVEVAALLLEEIPEEGRSVIRNLLVLDSKNNFSNIDDSSLKSYISLSVRLEPLFTCEKMWRPLVVGILENIMDVDLFYYIEPALHLMDKGVLAGKSIEKEVQAWGDWLLACAQEESKDENMELESSFLSLANDFPDGIFGIDFTYFAECLHKLAEEKEDDEESSANWNYSGESTQRESFGEGDAVRLFMSLLVDAEEDTETV